MSSQYQRSFYHPCDLNIMANHAMLRSVAEKYSDVSIKVQDKVFKSNRWALAAFSEYFDTLFDERWAGNREDEDSRTWTFTLHEVDAELFENILDFIFTGHIQVSDSNVFALMRANDYLLIRKNSIQEACTSYLNVQLYRPEPIPDAWKILEYSHAKKNKILVNTLSHHIVGHVNHFMNDPAFKEMSFDCVSAMLRRRNPTLVQNEYHILQFINCWIDHSRVKRKEYRKALMENFCPTNISASDYLSLLNLYEEFFDSMASEEGESGFRTVTDFHLRYPPTTFPSCRVEDWRERS